MDGHPGPLGAPHLDSGLRVAQVGEGLTGPARAAGLSSVTCWMSSPSVTVGRVPGTEISPAGVAGALRQGFTGLLTPSPLFRGPRGRRGPVLDAEGRLRS